MFCIVQLHIKILLLNCLLHTIALASQYEYDKCIIHLVLVRPTCIVLTTTITVNISSIITKCTTPVAIVFQWLVGLAILLNICPVLYDHVMWAAMGT